MLTNLRDATPADHRAIVDVFLACWRESYAAVMPARLVGSMTNDFAASRWRRALEQASPGQLVVAEDAEHPRLAGVLRWHVDAEPADGWIDSLYVAPWAQGLGVGGQLLDHAGRELAAAGAIEQRLWAFAANGPAIAFYERHGWRPDGAIRVEAEFDEPEIRLHRRVAAPSIGGAIEGVAERFVAPEPGESGGPAGLTIAVRGRQVDTRAVAGSRTTDASPPGVQPMTARTAHDLASVTKVVTTTALMRLVSQGQLGLDDPVRRYLPRFSSVVKDLVTVRHLLLHRAGLWEWWPLYAAGPDDPDFALDALPLRHAVGEARHYSDLGFMVLGRVIATVTASPLDAAVAELVTNPLGMTATRFRRPRRDDDVAMSAFDDRVEMAMLDSDEPYPTPFDSRDFDGWRTEPVIGAVNDGNAFHAYGGAAGHAGLFSTLDDLLLLGQGLARASDGDDLIDPAVAEEFYAPGPDEAQSLGFRRYSIELDEERVAVLGHTGFVGCAVGFVPGRDVAIAMASNRLVTSGTPATTDDLWAAVLGAAAEDLAS